MKKVRFIAREFARSIDEIQKKPFVGELAPKFEVGLLGHVGIYPSRTKKNVEYRCAVRHDDDEGWQGMCACRGWAQAKRTDGPAKPCVHIVDNLLRQDGFDMEAELGEEAMKAEQERAEMEEKKKAAKAALGVADAETEPSETKEPAEGAMRLWASSMPLLVACPASNVRPGECLRIRTTIQAAALGTVIHKAAEKIVGGQLTSPPDMALDLEDTGVTDPVLLEDAFNLAWAVVNEWNGKNGDKKDPLKAYFQTVNLEQRFMLNLEPKHPVTGEKSPISIVAILDVNGASGEEGRWLIIDWKTNRKEDEPFYSQQMRTNAAAILANKKEVHRVTVLTIWLRHGSRTIRTYTRENIREWLRERIKRTFFWDGVSYNTGDHCQYCPRVHVCEGRKTQLRRYLDTLSATDTQMLLYDDQGNLLAPDELQRRLAVCKAFRKIDKAFNDSLKALLLESGPRPLAEQPGFGLGIIETAGRLNVDVAASWNTLMEFVTAEQLTPALSITMKGLEEAIKAAKKQCEECDGDGFVKVSVGEGDDEHTETQECPTCKGTGAVDVYNRTKGKALKELLKRLEDEGSAVRGDTRKEIAVVEMKEVPAIEEGANEG